jgi:hypothetical protein
MLWFFRLINSPAQCSQNENTLLGFMNYRVSRWEFLGNKQVTKIAEISLIAPNQTEINNPCTARRIGSYTPLVRLR